LTVIEVIKNAQRQKSSENKPRFARYPFGRCMFQRLIRAVTHDAEERQA